MKLNGILKTQLTQVPERNKPIVICGTGHLEMALAAKIDSAAAGGGLGYIFCKTEEGPGNIYGVPAITLGELLEMDKETIVIISMSYDPYGTYKTLCSKGFVNILSENDLTLPEPILEERNCPKFNADLVNKNKSRVEEARKLLADDLSKKIFDTRIECFQTGSYEEIGKFYEPNQYWPGDIIKLERGSEVFVDCGTFDFENCLEFIFKTEMDYKHIYAFEMYAPFAGAIECKIERLGIKNVTLFGGFALGDKKRKVVYDPGNVCPFVSVEGTMSMAMDSLDNLLYDLPNRPTMIKADIEGMEVRALKGAAKILRRDKPRLAFSAYHILEHLWDVPLVINETEPSYKFYLRHHMRSTWETVCYAVAERG